LLVDILNKMLPLYPARLHWLLYALLFGLLLLLTPAAGHKFDVQFWENWAKHIGAHGLGNAYTIAHNNYNPLYQFVLFCYAKLVGSPQAITTYIHCLKGVTLLFDFGGAILAVRYFGWGDGNQRFLLSLLFLLNVGYLYNTVAWEQVDAIVSTLAFVAVVQALRHRPVGSFVWLVLALNMKTQAIIFLPPLLLLWAPQWWLAPRRLFWATGLGAVVQGLLLLPFIQAGTLPLLVAVVGGAVDHFPYVSLYCYNLWVFLFDNFVTSDSQSYAELSYKAWGVLSFCSASAIILLPLGLAAIYKLRTRTVFGPADYSLVLLSLGLIPLAFCFFNTQMHERYWHPALLLLGAHALLTRRYTLFGVFSLAYYLNLEAVLHYLGDFSRYPIIIFRPKLVAILFGGVMLSGIWQLYKLAKPWATWQKLRQPTHHAAATPA
jgi:Gpi18-like mannosyltransferase